MYPPVARASGSTSSRRDAWASAVTSGDATKLAQLVLVWSGSEPGRALSILRDCVSLMEKEVELSAQDLPPVLSSSAHGSTRDPCLEAFTVVLQNTCDGVSWLTSTKELQLASLQFCGACRSFNTLHLKVEKHTPRRLLAAASAPPTHPAGLCRTRVPRLGAREVTWDLRSGVELKRPLFAFTGVRRLTFGRCFDGAVEDILWPQQLMVLRLNPCFNKPIEHVAWPASLRRLEFSLLFDQPVERVAWPASLQVLGLGEHFNQPVEGVSWPSSLQKLNLGIMFNRPVEGVSWPDSLQEIRFGEFFNMPIEGVSWPDCLQEISFGDSFNMPIEGVAWPDSLRKLALGHEFDQPIKHVRWPASLQKVRVGEDFKQRTSNILWPPSFEGIYRRRPTPWRR